jgi:tetratricopeptide (TPR) repeat protein
MPTAEDMLTEAAQLHQIGKLAEAERTYREVLRLYPQQPHALNALGVLANQLGRPEAAILYFRQALAASPGQAEFHSNLGMAYKTTGDLVTAVALYREALRLKPEYVSGHIYLCEALIEQGQLDEARAHCLEALRLQPDCALAYCRLGEFVIQGWHAFSEADIATMQTLAVDPSQSDQHANLYFTLAAYWEKRGAYDEAFRCYTQANQLKGAVYRQGNQSYDARKHREQIDATIRVFTPELFASRRSHGHDSEQPVFVVGMVRSGTSLVEQILSSHPHVFGAGELNDIEQIAHSLRKWLGTPVPYPACVTAMDVAVSRKLAELYLKRLAQLGGGTALRVIDKLPHNYVHLGLIALLFPRVRIIHCRRDVLDACVSTYTQNFKWLNYSARLEDIGYYYRQYERIMAHWQRVLPMPMHEVVYEELVADQETISRKLVAFCGLDWDERCLDFYKSTHRVKTASRLQVRRPIYGHAVGRWKRFEAYLQPLRDALAGAEPA